MTLFVQSHVVDFNQLNKLIVDFRKQGYAFSSIYLGAGEIDVTLFSNLESCALLKDYRIIIETSEENFRFVVDNMQKWYYNIIVRVDAYYDVDAIRTSFKLRSSNKVQLYNFQDSQETYLDSLCNDMFLGNDILVYNDSEE